MYILDINSKASKPPEIKTITLNVQHNGQYQLSITQNGETMVYDKFTNFDKKYQHVREGVWDFSVDIRKLTDNKGSLYCSLRDQDGNMLKYDSTNDPYGEIHLRLLIK
jgi:predicted RNA-binding protein with RPS1 domain